jgi:hypothetical protein
MTSGVAVGLLAPLLLAVTPALGQGEIELPEDQRVGRYSSESSERAFVLDRTGELARLQFTNAPEIIPLDMIPGPRGDTFFKNECGATVLRLTPYGGATVFDSKTQQGEAFGWIEDADPLGLSSLPSEVVQEKSMAAIQDFNETFGLQLQFDTDWKAGSELGFGAATLGDAIANTLTALANLAADEFGREALADQVKEVSLKSSSTSMIQLLEGQLVVHYVWGSGVEGRPSSAAISCFLEENL